jgi:hypothetical protein
MRHLSLGNFFQYALLSASFLTLTACQLFQEPPIATAVLQSKSASNLNGYVNFSQSGKQVIVT